MAVSRAATSAPRPPMSAVGISSARLKPQIFDLAATDLLKVGETPAWGGGCLEYMATSVNGSGDFWNIWIVSHEFILVRVSTAGFM